MHYTVETRRFDATPANWLKLGSQCGQLANEWSGRSDIIAFIGKGATSGLAAALWNPVLAEMELNVDQAFGEGAKPEFIGDLTERDTQFDHPVACGAILHEAGHAKHTHFDFSKVRGLKDQRLASLIEWFEETRIESRMAKAWPKNRAFLRASALKLAVSDMEESAKAEEALNSAMSMSQLMLLTMARVTAGVLDPIDVQPVTEAANRMFGEPLVRDLTDIWTRAQGHYDDHDSEPLRKLAERWVKLLEDAGHKTKPEKGEGQPGGMPDALAEALGEIMDAMGEMAEDAEIRARGEASDQSDTEEEERQVQAAKEKDAEKDEAEKESNKVFGGKGTRDFTAKTSSKLQTERKPTDNERAAAVTIAKMLEKARYRDRVTVKRQTVMPPGRLRSRGMVQAAAEEARGAMRTATPWTSKHRYHVEDPELKLAMMTDISGSMSSAMLPMAASNWIFSEAGRRIQAKMASVYFGNSVFPGLSPGEHLDQVKVYTAADGTERFDAAFKALDGRLNLLDSTGARLLVVVSDLHHTATERTAETKWFTRCAQAGVAVIIIPFSSSGAYIKSTCEGLPVRILDEVKDPVQAALEIGHAAAEALEMAGNRG